jgi:hypothetical protein
LDPRFTGLNPSKGDGFQMAIKNPQYAFLRRQVELSPSRRKIVRHVEDPLEILTKILCMAKLITSFAIPFALLQDDSTDRIARELWRTNQEFPPVIAILQRFPMLHPGDEK